MITLNKVENSKLNSGDMFGILELRGLSTDTKPTKFDAFNVDNGSVYIEIDTGKIFMYDLENEQWKEM